ncbi:MAG: hypothetical protein E7290_05215 [Lachnospiraceae bacterium]|nr:hypothetical protein [Lachnospiraceae bacterium]
MIYKCPNCADALYYEPEENCLVCRSCDSRFQPEELDEGKYPKMRMDFHIYSCTACGAEIMVTPTETATYCVYCGQPVIVFDRVSSELKPDYIVPFKVTKKQAEYNIRQKIQKNTIVPKEFKDFKVDTLRGIYIPYWLYDIDYYDTQYYGVDKKILKGGTYKPMGYFREARMLLKNFPYMASRSLSAEELQALGKFNFLEMVPFDSGYLSGFYADRYDVDYMQDSKIVAQQAKEVFDGKMWSDLIKRYAGATLLYSNPTPMVYQVSYAMLPVWCMTCRYKGHPYTLFVNGQTGVVAGNLPIEKSKAWFVFMKYAFLFLPAIVLFTLAFMLDKAENILDRILHIGMSGLMVMVVNVALSIGLSSWSLIKNRLSFTRSVRVQTYVRKRQEV